ncbi:unnamed protein product [Parajaminaea phylloscopi]
MQTTQGRVKLPSPAGKWKNTEISAIRYGPGSLKAAVEAALTEDVPGDRRALIITGKTLNNKTDVVEKVRAALGSVYVDTFDEIGEHAPVNAIERAAELAKSSRINLLVSVGGGSPIDSAKAISHIIHEATNKGNDDPRSFIPSIAIPTTLSVAETTQNAGFTSGEGKKVGVSHPALVPRTIILDAELTLSTPQRLWLSSGMRAVDHAIEGLYRPNDFNWVLKNQLLGSLRDLFPLLRASKAAPDNVAIRQRLQLAVIASLFPEARRGALGLSHSLGHALGATYKIPHGITSCLTLASAVRFTAASPYTEPEQLASLADALSFIGDSASAALGAPVGLTDTFDEAAVQSLRERGRRVGDLIQTLVDDLGLSTSLSEYKVPEEDYPSIAAHATASLKDPEAKEKVVELLQGITKPHASL